MGWACVLGGLREVCDDTGGELGSAGTVSLSLWPRHSVPGLLD